MAEDARHRTKDYLDPTSGHVPAGYLSQANLTKDDGVTPALFIVCYSDPAYPIARVFYQKNIDLVYCIGEPDTEPLDDFDHYPIGYLEHVPIFTFCIDKTGITGTKLKWKADAELRRVTETYPLGSLRSLEKTGDNDKKLGSTILYSRNFTLNYRRDKT